MYPVLDRLSEAVASSRRLIIKSKINIVMEKKELWKFVVQTLLAVLTAIATALGASSCINMICS